MSLNAIYAPDNIFAKILKGEIPAAKVYEDTRVLSFMDAFPQSQGHTLVIPKVAACNLFDIPTDDLQYLMAQTQRIARAVRDALHPEGIRIVQFNGEPAGQTVFHLHFHIIPVGKNGVTRAHVSGGMAPMSDLEATANLIRAQLT